MAAEFLTFHFSFSYLYNSRVSFLFCLKVCGYEKSEALFLKLHEDWNDAYSIVHVLYKTPELRFSHSVSKDDGGKVARCLHSHVKWSYWLLLPLLFDEQIREPLLAATGRPLLHWLNHSLLTYILTYLLTYLFAYLAYLSASLYLFTYLPYLVIYLFIYFYLYTYLFICVCSYGDRNPKSVLARIFCTMWIIMGLVVTSSFMAMITTSLSARTVLHFPIHGSVVSYS